MKPRREEFKQREATLLKIIEVLDADNNSQNRHRVVQHASNAATEAGGAWEKPRNTTQPRAKKPAAVVQTANRFDSLTHSVDDVEQSEQIPLSQSASKNVTERRKKKKPAKKPSDNIDANNTASQATVQPAAQHNTSKPPRKEIILSGRFDGKKPRSQITELKSPS